MSKCKIKEIDKSRQRNQFSRCERDHLLAIMKQYGQRLEDKNLSILARKELWLTIDKKFRDAGFTDRSTAQLKKYWQNYKYHNGRNKWRKENPSMEIELLSKQINSQKIKLSQEKESMEPAVIISDASSSSVTVSFIHSNKSSNKLLFDSKKPTKDPDIKKDDVSKVLEKNTINKKCILLQPRKQMNDSTNPVINEENCLTDKTIESTKIQLSLQHRVNDHFHEENWPTRSKNDQYKVTGFFSAQNNHGNIVRNPEDTFHYPNFHVLQQLQLLRHLEAEEYHLKLKLAETHLKILHMKEEKHTNHDV